MKKDRKNTTADRRSNKQTSKRTNKHTHTQASRRRHSDTGMKIDRVIDNCMETCARQITEICQDGGRYGRREPWLICGSRGHPAVFATERGILT